MNEPSPERRVVSIFTIKRAICTGTRGILPMDIQLLLLKFCDYSKYIKGFTKTTIKRYRHSVTFFCRTLGVSELQEVNETNAIRFFFEGRALRHWSTNTYLSYHKSLSVFFRWCMNEGCLASNPLKAVELPKIERRLPAKLTKQQSQRLLEITYHYPYTHSFDRYRNHAIIATFMYAGLRKAELLNLKLADVDLDSLVIFVKMGKGNKDRTLPISYTLANILKRFLQERGRMNKTCPEFFTSTKNNRGYSETCLKRLIEKLRKISEVDFTIHKLRHTFATLMLEGGCDIYALSRMMGHNDIKTTTIYLYASVEHLKAQISKHPLN